MERRPDAHVRLRTGHNELANAESRQHLLQIGTVKRIAITLFDNRVACLWGKFGNDLPGFAACPEGFIGVLDPNNRHMCNPSAFNEFIDGTEDFIDFGSNTQMRGFTLMGAGPNLSIT